MPDAGHQTADGTRRRCPFASSGQKKAMKKVRIDRSAIALEPRFTAVLVNKLQVHFSIAFRHKPMRRVPDNTHEDAWVAEWEASFANSLSPGRTVNPGVHCN